MRIRVVRRHDFRNSRLKKVKEFRIVLIHRQRSRRASRRLSSCQGQSRRHSRMPALRQGNSAQRRHAVAAGSGRGSPTRSTAPSATAISAKGICPAFRRCSASTTAWRTNKIADLIHTGKGRMPGFPEPAGRRIDGAAALSHQPRIRVRNHGGKGDESSGACRSGRRALPPELRLLPRPRCDGRRDRPRSDAIEARPLRQDRREDRRGDSRRPARQQDARLQFLQPGDRRA